MRLPWGAGSAPDRRGSAGEGRVLDVGRPTEVGSSVGMSVQAPSTDAGFKVAALVAAPGRAVWRGGSGARGLLVYGALYVAWLLLASKTDTSRVWSGWFVLPLSLSIAVLAWRAGSRSELAPPVRRAMRLLAAAFAATFLGDLAWAWVETVHRADPSTSWANLPHLAYFPLACAALFSFPIAVRGPADARLHLLDVVTVVLGGGLLLVRFLVLPNVERYTGPADLLPLAYPLGDFVTLVGLARILLRRPVGAPALAMDLLAAGVLLNTAASTLWAGFEAYGVYRSAGVPDALRAVSYLLLVAAAVQAQMGPIVAPPSHAMAAPSDARSRRVLLATVGLAWALLLSAAVARLEPAALVPVSIGTVLLTGAVIARQTLAARESLRDLAERSAKQSTALFRSLVQTSSDAVLVLETKGTVRYASPAAAPLFGVDEDLLLGHPFLSAVAVDERAPLLSALRDAISRKPATHAVRTRVARADGETRVVECRFSNLLDDPTVAGIVVRATDVSEYHAEREHLFRMAFYDELTDMPRRELLRDRIGQALRARRRGLLDVAVLFVDLDEFKTVNDRFGHAVGDDVLREVASRLAACVREGDSAARVGGDEFAVLLSECVAEADAVAVSSRIVRAFAEPITIRGHDVTVGASVGVALAREEDEADALLRRADRAMYEAKRRGGRQWILHTPTMAALRGEGDG